MKRYLPQLLWGSLALTLLLLLFFYPGDVQAQTGAWHDVSMSNTPTERHECSFVEAGTGFYLMGGRGLKPVESYNPVDSSWTMLGNTPQEFHHFQASEYHGLVYVIAAFEGSYPIEDGIPFIYIYDPLTDTWVTGPDIPASRVRGSAGVVVKNNKFYVVCGIENGHQSGWVTWFDEYDPRTNTWTVLPDAPNARDHFSAVLAGDQLICAGGRRSGDGGGTWDSVVYKTDIYDFSSGTWSTLASPTGDLPTGRAGCSAAYLDGEVIIIGGESANQWPAHDEVEALDPVTGTWRSCDDMVDGRHGSQAIVNNGGIYIASGSGNRGCCPELPSMEAFYFGPKTDPILTPLAAGTMTASVTAAAVEPGSSGSGTVTLTHDSGNQAILINSLALTGDSEIVLDFSAEFPLALIPGEILDIPYTFSPTDTGSYSASLSVDYGAVSTTMDVAIDLQTAGCDATVAPDGLTSNTIAGTGALLSWNEVQGAEMCEVQGRPLGASSFAKLRFSVPPHEQLIPASALNLNTTYEWRVRCACSISPVIDTTPFSSLENFTTPASWLRASNPNPQKIALHPNPASETVQLTWTPMTGELQISLSDALGRLMIQMLMDASTGFTQLDLADFPAGFYQLTMRSTGGLESRKLVIE